MAFKIGQVVKLIQGPSRDCRTSCYDCLSYTDRKITITEFVENRRGGRTIKGRLNNKETCTFHPDDLRPLKINWRKRLEK